jgi:alanyl-tRNA synthetase
MMKSVDIRKTFLEFFTSKEHLIVPSAPMVIKNDPTLMFTNAGMNQFKDVFLGNSPAKSPRIADTQKCLRVSGKHNDLEEVGHDTYHHTMFEMLGNWSFGNYFKKEAIAWAWELLTEVLKIDKEKLYVTVFGGDETDNMPKDMEAYDFWKKIISEDRILFGSKKDNFWEMGDTGPCGPCSEIHVDIRSEEEKKLIPGKDLVNKDHPQVIEIWNLVFIEFNRLASGQLVQLPAKHVDTGMGFERLCMVLQNKKSNYDTDVFQPLIQEIAQLSGRPYGVDNKQDIAMRVIADHLRAVSFAIADGQLPSNNKAGYVIRRILRRAVRYGYTFLGFETPFMYKILPVLVNQMGDQFTELKSQQELIKRVIAEEEASFLRTLETGIKLLEQLSEKAKAEGRAEISGKDAFTLNDTYGFPLDLTELIAREQGLGVDRAGFDVEMQQQKERSRQAAAVDTDDWVIIREGEEVQFIGYDFLEAEVEILRYRKITQKNKTLYQLVFDRTPFYAESGGQAGDSGFIEANGEKISIIDTRKENNLIIHLTEKLPAQPEENFRAVVESGIRQMSACNHSATHLLHYALRQVLGTHVEQKGSLVNAENLRFDFSHFQKMTDEEIAKVEQMVNRLVRANIQLDEHREMPIAKAQKLGAMALFGEKYGDSVRVIRFGESVELCGGTHVSATGNIGLFKIVSEGAIAAGVRRIEAITAEKAEEMALSNFKTVGGFKAVFKSSADMVASLHDLVEQNAKLQKTIDALKREKALGLKDTLLASAREIKGVKFIAQRAELDAAAAKDLSFALKDTSDNLFVLLAFVNDGKPGISLMISEKLATERKLNAGQIVRELAKEIRGGGGGQTYFATAGGSYPEGIDAILAKAENMIE